MLEQQFSLLNELFLFLNLNPHLLNPDTAGNNLVVKNETHVGPFFRVVAGCVAQMTDWEDQPFRQPTATAEELKELDGVELPLVPSDGCQREPHTTVRLQVVLAVRAQTTSPGGLAELLVCAEGIN